ncbi:hypothetical protein JOL62DRAFT_81507 [Phyllosticta paracitricarpa]|uniref:Uncharacterized protein n=1 Tax=Phyllosticta paracitricarpa TaxID=2016321 RepID=A0ABR1N893_9PEZI
MVSRVNADSLPPVHRYRGPRACKPLQRHGRRQGCSLGNRTREFAGSWRLILVEWSAGVARDGLPEPDVHGKGAHLGSGGLAICCGIVMLQRCRVEGYSDQASAAADPAPGELPTYGALGASSPRCRTISTTTKVLRQGFSSASRLHRAPVWLTTPMKRSSKIVSSSDPSSGRGINLSTQSAYVVIPDHGFVKDYKCFFRRAGTAFRR